MAQHKITIGVDPSPNGGWAIVVDPNRQRASYGDEIEWVCGSPFLVYFGSYGPMTEDRYNRRRPKGKVKFKARLIARRFKYLVTVYYRNEIKLLDPDLEIVP